MGFPEQTFRYWRAHIDLKPTRSHFTFSDMFVYRIFDHFIEKMGLTVESLEQCDWNQIFHIANHSSFENLKSCRVLLDKEKNLVSLIHSKLRFDPDGEYLIWVHLKHVARDHENMLLVRTNPLKRVLSDEEFIS